MNKKHWRKAAVALLALTLTAGCSAKKSEESASHHTEPEKTPEPTPTPMPEPTPTPEPEKKKVHEFDPATNQVISFGEFLIQVPQDWKEGNDGWYAMRNGAAEVSASVIVDASGTEEASDEYLQNDPSIFGRFFTEGTYNAVSDTAVTVNDIFCRRAAIPTYQGEAAGTLHLQACLCSDPTQIAYVLLFEPSESAYDFSLDIQDILNSMARNPEGSVSRSGGNDHSAEIQAKLDAAELTFSTGKLEYSKKDTDLLSLVKCSDPDIKVTTDSRIDLKELGKQTVTFLLSLGDEQKEVTKTFEIVDTKIPDIKLKSNKVTLEYGASYDPYTNIESVSDPVDGAFKAVSGQKDAKINTYYIDGSVNTSKAGSYELTVHAMDANTNVSTKSFTVTVNPEPYKEPLYDYIANKNTKKFHYPECRSVDKMKEGNKKYFYDVTRDYMIQHGYSPCGNCNP